MARSRCPSEKPRVPCTLPRTPPRETFHELEEKGFIKRHVCGSFNWKLRHATTWILTEFAAGRKSSHQGVRALAASKFRSRSQPGDEASQSRDSRREILVMDSPGRPWFGTVDTVMGTRAVPNHGTHIVCHAMREMRHARAHRNDPFASAAIFTLALALKGLSHVAPLPFSDYRQVNAPGSRNELG